LKIRHLYRLNRLWVPCAVVVLGVLAGYFVGRESILHDVKSRLGDYANRIQERNESLGSEVTDILAEADAPGYPPCSEQDIALLRRLTFSARYLKDVGRLGEGNLLCSATLGKLAMQTPMLKPDLSLGARYSVYMHYPLKSPEGVSAAIVATKTTDVVLSPDIFYEFSQDPIHFASGIPSSRDSNSSESGGIASVGDHPKPSQTLRLSSELGVATIPSIVLKTQAAILIGDTIYSGRCSRRYGVCVVTSMHLSDVWKNNESLFLGYISSGGVSGVICATALLVAGRRRRSPANQLRRALRLGKLSVAYQPIVEMGSHRIVGAEALARWIDEDGDRIRPERIIALAESEGFASEITRFVITRSIEEIGPILEEIPDFRLHINLATPDLGDPRLPLLLDETLNGSTIRPANITFEFSERATADKQIAVDAIRMLKERGHAIYIDDFGTGYSNLAYLTELNVDGIKISRGFTATVGTESVIESIVPQILGVARALDLRVVVQGIERNEQAVYFASDDPSILGQGWFFGLPVPFRDLMENCVEKVS
jgi:sensor c-di-GMP phosphodiesterase-like protein